MHFQDGQINLYKLLMKLNKTKDMKSDNFKFDLPKNRSSDIKVIGVGGGGSNAVNYMYQQGIEGVDFAVCNTDAQALNSSPIPNRIQLGQSLTEGLGAGANPEVGEQAALESIDDLKKLLDERTKMVFITAGMGGGTGTGAAPVIAGLAKEAGILTVGIVTVPFQFEGKMRIKQAEEGIEKLRRNVDSLIVINNNKLRELYGDLGYKSGFAKADEILATAAKGVAEVISKHYDTNIDLKDARTVLADSGTAIMGTGKSSGENKAKNAITSALDSPLLNNNKIFGAKNVLLLIVSGSDEVTMDEIGVISDHIQEEAGNDVNIIMGVGEDLDLEDKISVTVVATGFPTDEQIYTGKEEKVIHRLEEEQPIVQKLSAETPFPVHVKKNVQIESTQKDEKTGTHRIVFPLEDEEIVEAQTPKEEKKMEAEEEMIVREVPEEEIKIEVNEEENEPKKTVEPLIFTLDDEIEIEEPEEEIENNDIFPEDDLELKIEKNSEGKKEIIAEESPKIKARREVEEASFDSADDPLNKPISETLSRVIEERSKRLKRFNYKFQNTLKNKSLEEVETVPAYKRKGVELSEREDRSPSDYVIGNDGESELKIKPNNFLHDNVD